ncbi:UDP-N-acetylmuramate dehydrogenase [Aeromonas hydrophila]|uniref:UDP-N-acetylmuramate dehydrogenase n=1 Tax=Aeromonas hydrophila TaxID=644 RepID=UPI001C5ABBA6|nr:UDP-N-acetylmuramate dehydrogenase [Aeromonas hydrophila]MBW3833152.1 UDP-N-acetylmuramate dehydrogenase [Aeromonas hydrophila]MBW5263757.1 UDP-N-acetylmuramate dehydrogenase [Aeromonas hydrophila]MBW5279062.1 UDP-N-acetylmuramate dehydrogenase [Aeromonas hydrophila]
MKLTPYASLLTFNTLALDAHCRWLAEVERIDDLPQLVANPELADLPRLVLGGGSNVLFCDDFAGVVVLNRLKGITLHDEGDHWLLHVAAGENWHELVCHSLQQGWFGLENLALIPGTVGAAPVQNIGAYGVELASVCAYVEAFNWQSGQLERIEAAACGFGYRDSIFKHAYQDSHFITAVGLRLTKAWQPVAGYGPLAALGEQPTAQAIFDTVCATRMAKLPDPAVLGNAGSFFKNPVVTAAQADQLKQQYPHMPCYPTADGQAKLAAGWLIDQCGLKGFAIGRAAVHQEQALVLVNLGGASAMELIALAAHVRDSVEQKFGVLLEHEVRFMGHSGETWLDEVLS